MISRIIDNLRIRLRPRIREALYPLGKWILEPEIDRLVTIVDEALGGYQPVMSVDETLSSLEDLIWKGRQCAANDEITLSRIREMVDKPDASQDQLVACIARLVTADCVGQKSESPREDSEGDSHRLRL